MIDSLAKGLVSCLSPQAFFQSSSIDGDQEDLTCLAALAGKALSSFPAYSLALRDLTQRNVQGVACDFSQSVVHKQDALKCADRGEFAPAACLFTDSLACIDETEHPYRTSICFTNRAFCLLQLQQYSNAAEDCLAALKLYHSNARAHFLRAIALKQLQQYAEAQKHAYSAASAAKAEGLPSAVHDASRVLADLQKLADSTAARLHNQASLPGASTSEPCITMPSLEIRDTASEGRALCMGSQEGATAGALLMQENPCASTMMKQHRKAVCHYCFKALQSEAAYPCQHCQLAWYCTIAHRDADSFHRPGSQSCGVPWTALLEERTVLATRLALASQEQPDLRALEHHIRKVPWPQLMEECVLGCLAAACVGLESADVLRAYRQVCVNAIAVVPALHTDSSQWLGLSVYPRAAMLNHACLPNVDARFDGLQLQLHALEAIPPSSTLRLCYGPQAGKYITAIRQKMLSEQYHFQCGCPACSHGPCSKADARLVGLRCAACAGPVVPSVACDPGICCLEPLPAHLPRAQSCLQCGRQMSGSEQSARLAALKGAKDAYDAACILLSEGRYQKPTQLLQSCLKVVRAELVPSNQMLGRTHATLAEAMADQGHTAEASCHAEAALQCVRLSYGKASLVAINEEHKWLSRGLRRI